MVRNITHDEQNFRTFLFWILGISIPAVIALLAFLTYSTITNNYVSEENCKQIEKSQEQINLMLYKQATDGQEIDDIREKLKEDKEWVKDELDKIKKKVYRGSGGSSPISMQPTKKKYEPLGL